MSRQKATWKLPAVLAIALVVLAGCNKTTDNNTTTTVVTASSGATDASQNPINPKTLVQFENPFIEIPIAPASGNTYTVTVRQYPNWDFGLRVIDPLTGQSAKLKNPVTGKVIETPTWYYDINGAALGIYGATVEVTSDNPATFTYVNDLRDEKLDANGNPMKGTGPLLTKHVLTVDPTVDGMNLGEPEVRIVTHLHGGHVDWRYDGHPEAWITNIPASQQTTVQYGLAADPSRGFPGRPSDNKVTYLYPNDQEASTLWFHDHSYGITRLAAYAGVAAFYIIRDDVDSGDTNTLGLPAGLYTNPTVSVASIKSYKYDLPVVLQDKSFTADGHLIFPTFTNLGVYTYTVLRDRNGNATQTVRPEMFGTVNVVNGQAWPTKTVEKTGYRFRFVNGADSRVYNLWLEDAETGEIITPALATAASSTRAWPIVQIAAEQGLFPEAVPAMTGPRDLGLTLANGQRADVVIDFSHPVFNNRKLILRNDAPAPFGGLFGPANEDMTTLDPTTTGKVMQFVVSGPTGTSYDAKIQAWSSSLRPMASLGAPDKTRYMDFQERKDLSYAFFDPIANTTTYRTQLLINGLRFSDPITETVPVDNVEEWVIINTTPDMHPLHLHLVKFQVIEKGYVQAGSGGLVPNYIRADGAGSLPAPIPSYTVYVPNTDPRGPDPSGTPTGLLVPDGPGNSLYARSGNETGWRDTVMVPPAQVNYDPNGANEVVNPGYVKVRASFDLPAGAQSPATYMYHCHILSHEEHEMMRPFTVE